MVDETETVETLFVGSLSVAQCVEVLWERGRRHALGDAVDVVLEVLGDVGEEEQGQDGRVLPVEQADDFAAEVGRRGDEDVVLAEVWVADAGTA